VPKGKKGRQKPPTIEAVLAQMGGVFLLEFYWEKGAYVGRFASLRDWHVIAIDCNSRVAWCNELGLLPFGCVAGTTPLSSRVQRPPLCECDGASVPALLRMSLDDERKESAGTHRELLECLHLRSVIRAWEVLRRQ
jgi:hypothetical protein